MSDMEETTLEPTPICIVSGFLGAGKTTFLNNLINGNHGLRIGVLVNDFGVINIDSQLVASSDEDTVSLSNGCICCSMREDFTGAILRLVTKQERPDVLLVETSGVSDPNAVVKALMNPRFAPLLHVETVATIVDAYHFLAFSDEQYRVADAQISAADLVVINKTDTVDGARLDKVEKRVRLSAPRARLVHTAYGKVPTALILGTPGAQLSVKTGRSSSCRCRSSNKGGHEHGRGHGRCSCADKHGDSNCACERHGHMHHDGGHAGEHQAFQSISYANANPMSMDRLREVLSNLPLSIYRLKGFFYVDAALDQRVLIQVVGDRISVTQIGYWGHRLPGNEVVAIGKRGAVDDRVLAKLLDQCLVDDVLSLEQSLMDETFLRL